MLSLDRLPKCSFETLLQGTPLVEIVRFSGSCLYEMQFDCSLRLHQFDCSRLCASLPSLAESANCLKTHYQPPHILKMFYQLLISSDASQITIDRQVTKLSLNLFTLRMLLESNLCSLCCGPKSQLLAIISGSREVNSLNDFTLHSILEGDQHHQVPF